MLATQVLRHYVLPKNLTTPACRLLTTFGRVFHPARHICSIQKGFRPT